MAEENEKPQKTFAEKMAVVVARFFGSWWAVVFHTFWFGVWLVLDFSLETLTLWVSLEAIFIGIFLLMAANKAEIERDRKESFQRAKQRRMIGYDISMDRKQTNEVEEIKKTLTRLEKQIANLTQISLKNQDGK